MNSLKNLPEILYEDKYLIVVDKPAGMVVQGAGTSEESLFLWLKRYLKERNNLEKEPFIGVVHRLDKPVSGPVIFAKRSKVAAKFFELFQSKKVVKIYVAKIKGRIRGDGIWRDYFVWNVAKKKAVLYDEEVEGSKPAITCFKGLEKGLVLLSPVTGRKHQLRAVLSKRGCPIIGDTKYGSHTKVLKGKAILLHSIFLAFPHPMTKELIKVFAKLPDYFFVKHLDKREILEFFYKVLKIQEAENVPA